MLRWCLTAWLIASFGTTVCLLPTSVWGQAAAPVPGTDTDVESSPLLYEPQTPEDMFSAIMLMIDLARVDLANRYLDQLLNAEPDDETLIRLRNRHGTGDFVKIARVPELKAKARILLDRLTEIARKQSENPEYADELIRLLRADPVQRELAFRDLRNLGPAAVPHILRTLSQPISAEQIDDLVLALARIGQPGVAPALAGLDSPQTQVRLAILAGLARMQDRSAIPYLWHPAFSEGEVTEVQQAARRALSQILSGSMKRPERLTASLAARELQRIAYELYFQQYEFELDDEGHTTLWAWDDTAKNVVHKKLPVDQAQLFLASRFARQALDLSPENVESQRIALGSQLGWTVALNGRDQMISVDPGTPGYVALTSGEQTMAAILSEALSARQSGTAQAALQILSEIGSLHQILNEQGRQSPVISAMNYPDQRVQFAAANAILRLEPKQAFGGANRVISILTRAISNPETSHALIIDADLSRAEVTSGYLFELGYTPVIVRTGKEGFVQASTKAGIDLAVIHVNCIQWDLTQTVANFRADSRTAFLPIVFYGPEDVTDVGATFDERNRRMFPSSASTLWGIGLPTSSPEYPVRSTMRGRVARLIQRNEPATFVAESGSPDDFGSQVRPFAQSVKAAQLSDTERARYQSAAVRWLAHLAQAELGHIYNLAPAEQALSKLVDDPNYAQASLVALSGIKTNTVQSRFLAICMNPQQDPAVRASSARFLAFHMQRHGILLSEDQVREFYATWKSESNPMLASAFAAVVGSLRPDDKTVGERIGELPVPR